MSEILTTTTAVIKALGGNQAVEELVGATYPQQVSNWHSKPTFPSNTFLVMTQALAAKGKSAPASLWRQIASQDQREAAQ